MARNRNNQNNGNKSWLNKKIRDYRRASWITSPPKPALKAISLLNYGLYAAATTFSVIKALTDSPPDSLTNIGMILAGASSIVQFGTKHVAALQNYNEAEDITTVNYADKNPHMFSGKTYLFSQCIQFLIMSVVLVSSGAAVADINKEHKFYLSMQLIANAVSILYSELLAHLYIDKGLKNMKKHVNLTQAQRSASYNVVNFWQMRGVTVWGKTNAQIENMKSFTVKAYTRLGDLSSEEAIDLSAGHRELLAHPAFIQWIEGINPKERKNKLKEILKINEHNIHPGVLNSKAVSDYISQGFLNMKDAVRMSGMHASLFWKYRNQFNRWIRLFSPQKLMKEFMKIADVPGVRINLNSLRREVMGLIQTEERLGRLSMQIAIQLNDEQIMTIRRGEINRYIMDGRLSGEEFLNMKTDVEIREYLHQQTHEANIRANP